MHLSGYDSAPFEGKRYMIIGLIFIFTFVLFTVMLKEKNWSRSFVAASIFSKNYNSHNNRSEKEPDVHTQLLAKDSLWFVPAFFGKAERRTSTNRLKTKRKICILNVDTRPLERFADVNDITKMQFYSIAAYNNLYYANRHGYDYLRITSPPIPSHHHSWTKVVQLYDVVQKYDIVVLLDADAYVVHPNTSIEFLLERYNFTVNSSLLMPIDPDTTFNKDSKGRITLNTGFIIAQNNNLTTHILKKLALCTRTIPGCDQWKGAWSFEQRAFSEYIRDQMKEGSELIMAPCNESNGFVGSGTECMGSFLSHVWTQKHTVGERLQKTMLNNLMTFLEKEMWENNHSLVALTSDIEKLGTQNNITNITATAYK